MKQLSVGFGLKLWSSKADLVEGVKKLIREKVFDYVELMPVPGTDMSLFVNSGLDFIIHVTHERFGFNIADPEKKIFNMDTFENCVEWADRLGAKYLVLHPGFGSFEASLDFLSAVDDKRVLIENMPVRGLNGESMVGYSPQQVKKLIGDRFGFCLDFGHAIYAAASTNKPYKEMLASFLKLKPMVFHVSDGYVEEETDEHRSLGDGNFDLDYIATCLRSQKEPLVTLETPRRNSLDEDVANVTYARQLLSSQL